MARKRKSRRDTLRLDSQGRLTSANVLDNANKLPICNEPTSGDEVFRAAVESFTTRQRCGGGYRVSRRTYSE